MNKKPVLYSICLLLFIDAVGAGLVFPVLLALFMDQEYGLLTNNLYFSKEVFYGLSLITFPLASIFGMPILGQISDRYGKGVIILYGMIGIIFTHLLCIASIVISNIWLFLCSRLLIGFLAGTYSVGIAMISDISDNDEDRISNFKLSSLASLTGVLLGPSFSIFIDYKKNPLIMPFVIATILGELNFMALWFNFKRVGIGFQLLRIQGIEFKLQDTQTNAIHYNKRFIAPAMITFSLFHTFTDTTTRFLSISFFFLQFSLGLYSYSLLLFLVTTFLYTPQNIGTLLVITSMVTILSIYVLQSFVTKYYKYQLQVKIGLILTSSLFILYASYSSALYLITWKTMRSLA